MADYHIYLHSESNSSGSGNKTQPFSQTQSSGNGNNFPTAKEAYGVAKTVAGGGIMNTGASALTKIAPWTAAIVILAKVTDKVLATGFAHQEEYIGDYKNNVWYNNLKTEIQNGMHPITFYFKQRHFQAQMDKHNKEIREQNKLIGNSILKDFNMGV